MGHGQIGRNLFIRLLLPPLATVLSAALEASERDSTQDWRLPASQAPPLLPELVRRVDEALAIARSSEGAVTTVGAAALEAAEQARRAAELAERASAALLAERRLHSAPVPVEPGRRMASFTERADRVVARLRALERLPA